MLSHTLRGFHPRLRDARSRLWHSFSRQDFCSARRAFCFTCFCSALCFGGGLRRSITAKNSAKPQRQRMPAYVQSEGKTKAPTAWACYHPRWPQSFAKNSATLHETALRFLRCSCLRCSFFCSVRSSREDIQALAAQGSPRKCFSPASWPISSSF